MFNTFLIIYNPNAGKQFGEYYANKLKIELEKKGASMVHLFKSETENKFKDFCLTLKVQENKPDCVIIIGGDGTVGKVVNYFVKNNINIPIASFGQGTCNDFTSEIKTKTSVKKFVKLLDKENVHKVDILSVNDRYGINVACGGAFTNGVVSYSNKFKHTFGKLAYYFKAIGCAFKLKPQRLSINIDGQDFREDIYLFLIVSSSRAGGIKNLSKYASITDGKLDFVAFKKCNFFKRLGIGLSVLFGTLLKNKNVMIKQGINFSVKPVHNVIKEFTVSDLDGDVGPNYPINVKSIKQKVLFVLSPKYILKKQKQDKELAKNLIASEKKAERRVIKEEKRKAAFEKNKIKKQMKIKKQNKIKENKKLLF